MPMRTEHCRWSHQHWALVLIALAVVLTAAPGQAEMTTGTYIGDGNLFQSISGLGFEPVVVIVKSDADEAAVIRTHSMPNHQSRVIAGNSALDWGYLGNFDGDGFWIGNKNEVNRDGRLYHYIAFSDDPGHITTGTYTGDGNFSQTITGLGLDPDLVLLLPHDAARCRMRTTEMPAGWSVPMDDGEAKPNHLVEFVPDGFVVGSDPGSNGLDKTFGYVAFAADGASTQVGHYIGDGDDGRVIGGAGFQPQWVLVKGVGNRRGVHLPAELTGQNRTLFFLPRNPMSDALMDLVADGFVVDSSDRVNGDGESYHWAAFTSRADDTADLSIALSADHIDPPLGGTVILTATIANAGPTDVIGADLQVAVPEGLLEQLVAATPGYTANLSTPSEVRFIYDIPAGEERSVIVDYEILNGPILRTFSGHVSAAQPDDDLSNNEAIVDLTIPTSDLALSIMTSDAAPTAGDTIQVTVHVVNNGPDSDPTAAATVTAPVGMIFVGASASGGTIDFDTGDWTLPNLAPSDEETLLIDAVIGADQDGEILTVNADVTGTRNDNDLSNNSASVAHSVGGGSDLQAMAAFDPSDAAPGDSVDLELTVVNAGPDDTASFDATVTLPATLTYQSHTVDIGEYDDGTGAWTASTTLEVDATATLTITATVAGDDAGIAIAGLSVTGPSTDPAPDNNSSVSFLTLDGAFDLVPAMGWLPNAATAGDTVGVVLTIGNDGPGAATGFAADLTLPDGFTYISHSAGAGDFDSATGRWDVAVPLAPLATQTIMVTCVSPADGSGPYQSTAEIIAQAGETNPANDTTSDSITLTASTDLAVAAVFDPESGLTGSATNLTITLVNQGPGPADGFVVALTIPDGLGFANEASVDGAFDSGTGVWTSVEPLAVGGSADLTLELDVQDDASGLQIVTAVATPSASIDPAPDNDTASATFTVLGSAFISVRSVPFGDNERVLLPGGPLVDLLRLRIVNNSTTWDTLTTLTVYNPGDGGHDQATHDAFWRELHVRTDSGDSIDLGGFTDGAVVAADLGLAIAPTDSVDLVLRGAVVLDIPDGIVMQPTINGPSDLVFSSPVAMQGDWPITVNGVLAVDGMSAAQITLDPVGAEIFQMGSTRNLALDITVPSNGHLEDHLIKLNVVNEGTADHGTVLTRFEAWTDDGDSLFDAAADTWISELHWTGGERYEASSLDVLIPDGGRRFFVTVDIAEDALGGTVQLSLPAGDDAAIGVTSGNDGPVDIPVTNPFVQTISSTDKVIVTTSAIPTRTVYPGDTSVMLLSLVARNLYDEAHTLRRLRIRNMAQGTGDPGQSALDGIAPHLMLYRDDNHNGQLETDGTDRMLASTTWDGAIAIFEGVNWQLDPDDVLALFVTTTVSLSGAADGDILGAVVGSVTDLQFIEDTAVAAAWPLDSGARHEVDGLVAAQIACPAVPPVSLTANEGPTLALDLTIPSNGYMVETVDQIRFTNLGSAVPEDIHELGLWTDDGNGIFEPGSDNRIATMTGMGSDWMALGLDLPIPVGGRRLFAGITVAATPQDSSTVRLAIPVDGLVMASENDGPIDAAVTSSTSLLISTAPLLSTMAFDANYSTTDMTTTVTMRVNNVGGEAVNDVVPSDVVLTGDGGMALLTGPEPATIDLADGAQGIFTWTMAGEADGMVFTTANCGGVSAVGGQPRGSLATSSAPHTVLLPAQDLELYPVVNMPFSINRGQAGVVPLTLTLLNGGGPERAGLRLTRLVVSLDDGDGVGVVPGDLLSAVMLHEGVNVYCNVTAPETSGNTLTLDLDPAVVVTALEPVTLSLRMNIRGDTEVDRFRVSLESTDDIMVLDSVSGFARSVYLTNGAFPVCSAAGNIVSQASGLVVLADDLPDRTAGAGQSAVELLRLSLSGEGTDTSSEVKIGGFAVSIVDADGHRLADAADRLSRLWVEGPLAVHAVHELDSAADSLVVFELSPQITVPVGASDISVAVHGRLQDDPVLGPLSLHLEDTALFDARDGNVGAAVGITYQPAVIDGPEVTVQEATTWLTMDVTGHLPGILPQGARDVAALTLVLNHPGTPTSGAVVLDTLRLNCLNGDRQPQPPGVIVDGYRVAWNGADVGAPVLYQNAQIVIPLGNRVIEPQASSTLTLHLDLEADAPAIGFELMVTDTCFVAYDANLLDPVACVAAAGLVLPASSGLTYLQPASEEVELTWTDVLPPLMPSDGSAIDVAELQLSNPAGVGAAPVWLNSLSIRTADRHAQPLAAGTVLESAELVVDGNVWATALAGAPADSTLSLVGAAPVDIAAGTAIEIVLRVTPRAGASSDGVSFGIRSSDVDCTQPDGNTPVTIRPGAGLVFPLWTAAAGLGANDLAASYINFPNPFAAGRQPTRFAFQMPRSGRVTLRIWNPRGEAVSTVLEECPLGAELHQDITWDGRNDRGTVVRNGVYLAELKVAFDDGSSERLLRKVAVVR